MKTKTNILFYTGHSEIVGGDAKYLFDLANSLDPTRFSFETCTDINPVFEKRAEQWLKTEMKIGYLDTKPVLFTGDVSCERMGKLLRTLTFQWLKDAIHNAAIFYNLLKDRRGMYDILHVNNGGYPGKQACLIAILVAKYLRVPRIILSIHNIPCERKWYQLKARIVDYFIAKSCHVIITASQALTEKMVQIRGFDTKKIRTIYCGIEDVKPLMPEEIDLKKREIGISTNKSVLIISGNIEEDRKGHIILFRAIAELKVKYPDMYVLVVGDGTSSRVRYLQEVVDQLEIRKHIRFLGYRCDIHELNCLADVAVIPSLRDEATPYTIKEAARAGKPVITTSAGGCAEAVIPNKTGLIVSPGEVQELVAAIDYLLANNDIAREMGLAARTEFYKRFLLENTVKQHEEIYKFNIESRENL